MCIGVSLRIIYWLFQLVSYLLQNLPDTDIRIIKHATVHKMIPFVIYRVIKALVRALYADITVSQLIGRLVQFQICHLFKQEFRHLCKTKAIYIKSLVLIALMKHHDITYRHGMSSEIGGMLHIELIIEIIQSRSRLQLRFIDQIVIISLDLASILLQTLQSLKADIP